MKYKQLVHRILQELHLEVGEDVNEHTVPKLCELIKDSVSPEPVKEEVIKKILLSHSKEYKVDTNIIEGELDEYIWSGEIDDIVKEISQVL